MQDLSRALCDQLRSASHCSSLEKSVLKTDRSQTTELSFDFYSLRQSEGRRANARKVVNRGPGKLYLVGYHTACNIPVKFLLLG